MKTIQQAQSFAKRMSELYSEPWVPFRETLTALNSYRAPEYYACPEKSVEEYKNMGCVFDIKGPTQ